MTTTTLPPVAREIEAQILKGCGSRVEWFFRSGDAYTLLGPLDATHAAIPFCGSNGLAGLTEEIHYEDEAEEAYGYLVAA
jgi:hypothetical protein